jgi:hypothetical protein
MLNTIYASAAVRPMLSQRVIIAQRDVTVTTSSCAHGQGLRAVSNLCGGCASWLDSRAATSINQLTFAQLPGTEHLSGSQLPAAFGGAQRVTTFSVGN